MWKGKVASMEKSKPDFFGYLPYESQISFIGGKVSPRQDFHDVVAWVNKHANLDGFLYPPNEQQLRTDDISSVEWQEVSNTQQPALLHRIPPSHELCLDSHAEAEDARKEFGLIYYPFARLSFWRKAPVLRLVVRWSNSCQKHA